MYIPVFISITLEKETSITYYQCIHLIGVDFIKVSIMCYKNKEVRTSIFIIDTRLSIPWTSMQVLVNNG